MSAFLKQVWGFDQFSSVWVQFSGADPSNPFKSKLASPSQKSLFSNFKLRFPSSQADVKPGPIEDGTGDDKSNYALSTQRSKIYQSPFSPQALWQEGGPLQVV